jgi:hypothetical protein
MAKVFQVDTGGTLTTGLVAYYKEEDATDFWGTNNGTDVGSPTYTSGKINSALTLDGTQYQTVPNGVVNWTGNFSIAFWFKRNSGTQFQLIGSQIGGTQGFTIDYGVNGGAGNLSFTTLARANANYAWTPDSNWHFIVATYSTTAGLKLYLDNSLVATNGTLGIGNTGIAIGHGTRYNLNDFKLNGQLDEIGYWSKVLSTQEISDLYNNGNGQTMIEQVVNTRRRLLLTV